MTTPDMNDKQEPYAALIKGITNEESLHLGIIKHGNCFTNEGTFTLEMLGQYECTYLYTSPPTAKASRVAALMEACNLPKYGMSITKGDKKTMVASEKYIEVNAIQSLITNDDRDALTKLIAKAYVLGHTSKGKLTPKEAVDRILNQHKENSPSGG